MVAGLDTETAQRTAADRIAAMLYRRGARHVWAFGSLGQQRSMDRKSDLDLAVDGISPQAFAAARLEAFALARGRVDLLMVENATPNIRWAIHRDGRLMPRPDDGPPPVAVPPRVADPDVPRSLHALRLDMVASVLATNGARSVIDFGCGQGWLIEQLCRAGQVDRVTGIDIDPRSLAAARRRLAPLVVAHPDLSMRLLQGLPTHAAVAYAGHDAAVATEVIEHLDPAPLAAFAAVLFSRLRYPLVVLTTPNAEFNALLSRGHAPQLRHHDHRFEWSRGEFAHWANEQATANGYTLDIRGIGAADPDRGAPSQMAVFVRSDPGATMD